MPTEPKPYHLTIKNNSPEYKRLYRLSKKFKQPLSTLTKRHLELLPTKVSKEQFRAILCHQAMRTLYRINTNSQSAPLSEFVNILKQTDLKTFTNALQRIISTDYDNSPQYLSNNPNWSEYALKSMPPVRLTNHNSSDRQKIYRIAKSAQVSPETIPQAVINALESPELLWIAVDTYIQLESLLSPVDCWQLLKTIGLYEQAFDNFEKLLQGVLTAEF